MIKKVEKIKLINKNINKYIDSHSVLGDDKFQYLFLENIVLLIEKKLKKVHIFVNNSKIENGIIFIKKYVT